MPPMPKLQVSVGNWRSLLSDALLILTIVIHVLTLSTPLVRASQTYLPLGRENSALQGQTKDVAVTSIVQIGPPFANEGDTVTIQVGIVNNGSSEETFSVSLHDDTENKAIASKEITLDANSSTTASLDWDTNGASGGPPPPGPPTPGTIHSLTATAVLEGDSNSSNNSLSLLPGIWIIAAPEASEITFPEPLEIPQAKYGEELPLDVPLVQTESVALSSTFVGPVQGMNSLEASNASIQTEGKMLSSVFKGPVDADNDSELEDPNIGTEGGKLSEIFNAGIQSKVTENLANPNIETVSELLTRILSDNTDARVDEFLLKPGIDTEIAPLTSIQVDDADSDSLSSLSDPDLQTEAELLTEIFYSEIEGNRNQMLSVPAILTDALPLAEIMSDITQDRVLKVFSAPAIETEAMGLTEMFVSPLSAMSTLGSNRPDINTSAIPLSVIFPGSVQARLAHSIRETEVATKPDPLSRLHVFGGAVTYQPGQAMARPLVKTTINGTIRGRIRLQNLSGGLGAYVTIGDEVTFADREGRFEASAPTETFDLYIGAPGHIPVVITGITLDSRASLEIPEVTLLFGDANGDGVVNIYDLAVAAFNYGETIRTVPAP